MVSIIGNKLPCDTFGMFPGGCKIYALHKSLIFEWYERFEVRTANISICLSTSFTDANKTVNQEKWCSKGCSLYELIPESLRDSLFTSFFSA